MVKGLLLGGLLVLTPGGAWPQEEPSRVPAEAAKPTWGRLFGRVESKDARIPALRLRDGEGNLVDVRIDGSIQIFRHWRLVSFNSIRRHDRVQLRRKRL